MISCFFFLLITASTSILPSHQAALPHATLTIGSSQIDVRLATDTTSREQGLMQEKSLGPNEGMLFVFARAQQVSFWMKNTPLPLSIAYIGPTGRILETHNLEPYSEQSILSSSSAVLYALEVPRGWFEKQHILPGDSIQGLPGPAVQ